VIYFIPITHKTDLKTSINVLCNILIGIFNKFKVSTVNNVVSTSSTFHNIIYLVLTTTTLYTNVYSNYVYNNVYSNYL